MRTSDGGLNGSAHRRIADLEGWMSAHRRIADLIPSHGERQLMAQPGSSNILHNLSKHHRRRVYNFDSVPNIRANTSAGR